MTKRRKPQPQPARQVVTANLQAEIATYDAPVKFQPGDQCDFNLSPEGRMQVTAIRRNGVQIWPEVKAA